MTVCVGIRNISSYLKIPSLDNPAKHINYKPSISVYYKVLQTWYVKITTGWENGCGLYLLGKFQKGYITPFFRVKIKIKRLMSTPKYLKVYPHKNSRVYRKGNWKDNFGRKNDYLTDLILIIKTDNIYNVTKRGANSRKLTPRLQKTVWFQIFIDTQIQPTRNWNAEDTKYKENLCWKLIPRTCLLLKDRSSVLITYKPQTLFYLSCIFVNSMTLGVINVVSLTLKGILVPHLR